MLVSFKSNKAGVASEAGTTNSSGALDFNPDFLCDSCCLIFSFLCSAL
jgi:hypothetical protein